MLQFHNVLIYVLLAAALVTALLGHAVDTGVILGVVLVNAIVGFLQEGKAEKALAAIRGMLFLRATALRDGRTLVVPADLRLLRVKGLRTDEAPLTGESVPLEKRVEPVAAQAALGDRFCMAYSGTLVAAGTGTGLVVATGDRTEFGRISTLLEQTERIETPLLRKIGQFGRWLSGVTVLLAYTYAPFMQAWFHGGPLDAFAWIRIVLLAASVYVLVELEKWIVRRLGLTPS